MLIPNANSPQLLTRLLELVARGVRTARSLQEALGVDVRTVQYYTQAAEWLGMLETEEDTTLTPLGLEYVYTYRDRPAVYARAVWSTPLVTRIMASGTGTMPPDTEIAKAISEVDPELAPATVRRRASAIRSLIAPGLDHGPLSQEPQQLDLPLGPEAARGQPPELNLDAGREYNPDVYRFLLESLLDHGELTLANVRSLLDRAGAREAPIGGYVDLALARGDAVRMEDRLVVTANAVAHRELAATTPSIILSDPGYRAWLTDLLMVDGDRSAQIRRDQLAARFQSWDRRLFGRPADPDTLTADLGRVLMDRPLESYPLRGEVGAPLTVERAPFLDVPDRTGIAIALPPPLVGTGGGVALVNQVLRDARHGTRGVGPPDLADRPAVVHGGLLHPGEPPMRAVPDTRSLRLRLLTNAPYPALTTALLLLHRLDAGRVQIVEQQGRWIVRLGGGPRGDLLSVLDGFALERSWIPCRRQQGAVDASMLLGLLEQLDIAALVAGRAVLAEPFFTRLRREAEEMEVRARLQPLAELLSDHLHQLPALPVESR
jgi:hypothetical protein